MLRLKAILKIILLTITSPLWLLALLIILAIILWNMDNEEIESDPLNNCRHKKIIVGSYAIALQDTLICSKGEIGICYEVYILGEHLGYSFIFERGGYDGFSLKEIEKYLYINGKYSNYISNYKFKNVSRLCEDYRNGYFDKAFMEGK